LCRCVFHLCTPHSIADLPPAQINVRLTPAEVTYLLENSGAKFVLVDSEFAHLVAATKVPVIVSNDSGLAADPYEKFLVEGREYDLRNGGFGWEGLEFQADELATFAISYTSGTTSRPKGVETSYRGTYLAAIGESLRSRSGFLALTWTSLSECGREWTHPVVPLPLDPPDVPLLGVVLPVRQHHGHVDTGLPQIGRRLQRGLEGILGAWSHSLLWR
jgi:acyl-CoA synthetase (AMP-forming)/AMP-acid ligase II